MGEQPKDPYVPYRDRVTPPTPPGLLRRLPARGEQPGMKVCPRCAEEVKDAAVVCRYCGWDFASAQVTPVGVGAQVAEQREDHPTALVVVGYVLAVFIPIVGSSSGCLGQPGNVANGRRGRAFGSSSRRACVSSIALGTSARVGQSRPETQPRTLPERASDRTDRPGSRKGIREPKPTRSGPNSNPADSRLPPRSGRSVRLPSRSRPPLGLAAVTSTHYPRTHNSWVGAANGPPRGHDLIWRT